MADPEILNVQNNPARDLGRVLEFWKANLSAIDKKIKGFDNLPSGDKHNEAAYLRIRTFTQYQLLSDFGESRYSSGPFAASLPKDLRSTAGFIASPNSGNEQSARLWALGIRLGDAMAAEQDLKLSPDKAWSTPQSRAAIKDVQRIWSEIKPQLEKLLADPRTVKAYEQSNEFKSREAAKTLRKYADGEDERARPLNMPRPKNLI